MGGKEEKGSKTGQEGGSWPRSTCFDERCREVEKPVYTRDMFCGTTRKGEGESILKKKRRRRGINLKKAPDRKRNR